MTTYCGVLETYRSVLDIPAHTRTITLLEGNTPLISVPHLAEKLGGGFELLVKFEGMNPTGSFKDRGMTIAVVKPWVKAPNQSSALPPEIQPPQLPLMLRAQACAQLSSSQLVKLPQVNLPAQLHTALK
jgi:hypothetical protein